MRGSWQTTRPGLHRSPTARDRPSSSFRYDIATDANHTTDGSRLLSRAPRFARDTFTLGLPHSPPPAAPLHSHPLQHLVHFIWAAPKGGPTTYRLTQAFWLTDHPSPPFDYSEDIKCQVR